MNSEITTLQSLVDALNQGKIITNTEPVSYTHLDVYKRQFLDLPNRYELCLLLKKLAQEEKKCVLFSTHDLDIALSLCDSIMLIDLSLIHI